MANRSPIVTSAKNVIVLIGDGIGTSSVTASRIWEGRQRGETGEENFLSWEKFPHVTMSKTYKTNQQVAESADTASAWNTGVKAQAGMIATDSYVNAAIASPCKTMKDPEDDPKTGSRRDDRDLTKDWSEKYENSAYVLNQAQFDSIDPNKTDHLLGQFNRSHMQYDADRLKKDRGGEPSLAEMTVESIDILSRNPKGYFLQIEGERVDHANHDNNAYRMMTDAAALSAAVKAALE